MACVKKFNKSDNTLLNKATRDHNEKKIRKKIRKMLGFPLTISNALSQLTDVD